MQTTINNTSNAVLKDVISGVNLADVYATIMSKLNKREQVLYATAVQHATQKVPLSRLDLTMLDRVDEITMKEHNMCLKDSVITKARIKACKKFKINFNDRDGLVEHMRMFYKSTDTLQASAIAEHEVDTKLAYLLIERLGEDAVWAFKLATDKILNWELLNYEDLRVIASVEKIFNLELDATFFGNDTLAAISRAEKELGLDFAKACEETLI
jgi:hypothetical protein